MFKLNDLEYLIRGSQWWQQAMCMPDRHENNTGMVMLADHLQAVYNNVDLIFQQEPVGFYGQLFLLMEQLHVDPVLFCNELKIVALLHDVGKTAEDKTQVIPHPLTGKPAHKRHGLVGLMAAMEILADRMDHMPGSRNCIYRAVELHDISYGLFREFKLAHIIPGFERWAYINDKIHPQPGVGLLYLLVFKLADIHGHADIGDVLWFYETVKQHYFDRLNIVLPIPGERDIR